MGLHMAKSDKKVLEVGVLLGSVHTKHPMEVLRGMYAGAFGKNVNITIFPTMLGGIYASWNERDAKGENGDGLTFRNYDYQYSSIYDYPLFASLDAIVIAFGTVSMFLSEPEKVEFFKKFANIPTIVIQEYELNRKFSYIIADNYNGVRKLVDHLIEEHNRKKILFLGGPRMNTDAVERLRAYHDSLILHNMKVSLDMFTYGNYTSRVEHLVHKLLDNNPDADALVCANDEMAIAAYKVCRERGINIGKDFSITGFDDIEFVRRMNPPLSTVRQDAFLLGMKAIELAINGVCNDRNELYMLECPVVFRGSCGCEFAFTDKAVGRLYGDDLQGTGMGLHIHDLAYRYAEKCMGLQYSEKSFEVVESFFKNILELLEKIRSADITTLNEHLLNDEYDKYLTFLFENQTYEDINWEALTSCAHRIFMEEMNGRNNNKISILCSTFLEMTYQHIQAFLLQRDTLRNDRLIRRYWDVPVVIQHMKELARDWNGFFRLAMEQVRDEGAKSAYIYLAPKAVKRYETDRFACPEKLYLTAVLEGGKIRVYKEKEGEVVDMERGFTTLYPTSPGHMFEVFLLFSEENQYGIMVCELKPDQVSGMHGVGMQISSGLSYMNMVRREDNIKNELYETMRIIREKNQILNAVSSNDPMTGIFNRRGFMERMLELNRKNDGLQAYLFFIDLDHLKSINDLFGHKEGDFALKQLANVLKEVIDDRGCCGRIGGDEFTAMIAGDESVAKEVAFEIKESLRKFNENSDKPYFVECSIGYTGYLCTEDVIVDKIIGKADDIMYVDKKNKRKTVIKSEELNVQG